MKVRIEAVNSEHPRNPTKGQGEHGFQGNPHLPKARCGLPYQDRKVMIQVNRRQDEGRARDL